MLTWLSSLKRFLVPLVRPCSAGPLSSCVTLSSRPLHLGSYNFIPVVVEIYPLFLVQRFLLVSVGAALRRPLVIDPIRARRFRPRSGLLRIPGEATRFSTVFRAFGVASISYVGVVRTLSRASDRFSPSPLPRLRYPFRRSLMRAFFHLMGNRSATLLSLSAGFTQLMGFFRPVERFDAPTSSGCTAVAPLSRGRAVMRTLNTFHEAPPRSPFQARA